MDRDEQWIATRLVAIARLSEGCRVRVRLRPDCPGRAGVLCNWDETRPHDAWEDSRVGTLVRIAGTSRDHCYWVRFDAPEPALEPYPIAALPYDPEELSPVRVRGPRRRRRC